MTTACAYAQKHAGANYREATADARTWLEDCAERLSDGRLVRTLGAAEVWFLVARNYDGGTCNPIDAFLSDARFTS